MYPVIGLLVVALVCAGWWGWAQRAQLIEVEWRAEAAVNELRLKLKQTDSREEALRKVLDGELQKCAALERERKDWERCGRENLELVLKLRNKASMARGFLERMEEQEVNNAQVLSAFGMADEGTAWWKAVNGFVALQARIERGNALAANLSSESRHFNAGRAAALEDLREQFVQLRQRGREEETKAA